MNTFIIISGCLPVIRSKRNDPLKRNILFASGSIAGATLYTWPFMSCAPCAALVIQSGIVRCVAPRSDNPRWAADFLLSQEMFKEAGVKLDLTEPVLSNDWLIPVKGDYGSR